MTANGGFTCPACGAEFDVTERLDEEAERPAPAAPTPAPIEPVSFQCPACGADYETQVQLGDDAVR